MGQRREEESGGRPAVREHPEQRRQEETGHEDASEASEVGRPPSEEQKPEGSDRAA
jgi:hypothetical protein